MYKAAYYFDDDGVTAHVLDFPAVVSCGKDLPEARRMVQSAISDMAEYYIETGRPLPHPNSTLTDLEAELEEPLPLLPIA
jgi:predicted RNase H-like HicB family nuclease